MLKGKTFLGVLFAAAICSPLFSSPAQAALDADLRCRLGAYSLSDGRSLIVIGYNGTPRDLEYVLSSGEYGHLVATSTDNYTLKTSAGHDYGLVSFTECALGKVTFNESGRPGVTGTRMSMNVAETFFDSGGTRLHGKLVLPANDKADAIVVWIQGSDDDPETDDIFWQYLLPLHGIGVFTYDKRGSGQSQGELTADFYLRAADTAAAVKEARELAPGVTRFGDFGGSQGGWIAPLTATKTELDFVIVGYGLAEGVTAQDRDEVEEMVRDAGYGDEVMPKVHEITAATTRIVKSEWKSGWHQFVAVERKYTNEPWMKAISGENGYTAKMLAMPIDKVSELGPIMGPKLDKHVSFNYDPRPVIATIKPQQLWVLGGADRTAPTAKTIQILKNIQRRKHTLDLAIYKAADHGIAETFTLNGVERHRYPSGYFDLIAEWIREGTLPAANDDLELRPGTK